VLSVLPFDNRVRFLEGLSEFLCGAVRPDGTTAYLYQHLHTSHKKVALAHLSVWRYAGPDRSRFRRKLAHGSLSSHRLR